MTPIDAALLLVAAVVAFWAWLIRSSTWMPAVLAAIPALVAVEISIPDERLRLLAIGLVTSAAFAAALWSAWVLLPGDGGMPLTLYVAFGVSAVIVLRWIPLATVEWKKEIIVMVGTAVLLALTKERTPLSLAIALGIALVTPLHPGRMTLYPALVGVAQWLTPWPLAAGVLLLAAAIIARYSLAALYLLAAAALLVPLASRRSPLATRIVLVFGVLLLSLWPWSGAVARLLPLPVAGVAVGIVALLAVSGRVATIAGTALLLLLPGLRRFDDDQPNVVGAALESSQSVDVDLTPDVRQVVLRISGANMPRMRPGRVVGEIDAVDGAGKQIRRVLRIGDVADWGFMRREQFFFSKNVPPRNGSGDLRGYGNQSYLYGAGRIPIRFNGRPASLRVVAANDLPAGAKLQVETVEYRKE